MPVCYRMSAVDLPRATAVAEKCTYPFAKAHAYGVMAVQVTKTDTQKLPVG